MKRHFFKVFFLILIFFLGSFVGILVRHYPTLWLLIKKPVKAVFYNENNQWHSDFSIIEIKSSIDNTFQKTYYYQTSSKTPKPLIVSLHTWGGNYAEKDPLSDICKTNNINYIHPDFRGINNTLNACSSKLALTDIDDAISYAISNFNVDSSKIYVVGVSGCGFATLNTFLHSKHQIKKFSAWASITDLTAWYDESNLRNNGFSNDILKCTNSDNKLNIKNAKNRSPLHNKTPIKKLRESELYIYAGIYDGIQGSVPITHSINYYNKILEDLQVSDSSKYVSNSEKLKLIEKRKPLGEYGFIGNRKICLKKKHRNVNLVIFEGQHEILTHYAFNSLIN